MRTVLFLLMTSHTVFSMGGLSITGGLPHRVQSGHSYGVYGLSYFLPSEKVLGFHEFGFVAQPVAHLKTADLSDRAKWETWGAVVTGHLFLWSPWFRPGFDLGPMYGHTLLLDNGKAIEANRLGMYYGFNVQVLFLSFTLSNMSAGAGLNFTLP